MEWVVWYGIVLIILVGIIIWLVICFIDMKKDRNNWKLKYKLANAKMEVHEGISLDNAPTNMVSAKPFENREFLEKQLETIKFNEKYPLCHEIKNAKCIFVEFYIHGKSIGKWTKSGAIEYAKANLQQSNSFFIPLPKWGIRDVAYEVKKLKAVKVKKEGEKL